MKQIITLLTCFLLYTAVQAQEKIKVAIVPFQGCKDNLEQELMSGLAYSLFARSNVFVILERGQMDLVKAEKEAQKMNEDLLIAEQGKMIGADYVVTGNVSSYLGGGSNKVVENKKVKVLTGELKFTIKIVDVTEGKIIATKSVEKQLNSVLKANDYRYFAKPDYLSSEAKRALMDLGFYSSSSIMDEAFPFDMQVVEVIDAKKDKAKEVLVAGKGIIFNGQYLEAFQKVYESIDGEQLERHVEVGLLKIKNINKDGYQMGTGAVIEGEKEIFTALEQGKLFVKPTEKKRGLDKLLNRMYNK